MRMAVWCAQSLQLGGILLVGVVDVLEGAGTVDEIPGVDAHLLHDTGGQVGHMGIEVYVGHQRGVVAPVVQLLFDDGQALGLAGTLCRESHIVGSGLDDAHALFDTGFGFVGVRVGHRLYAYGVVSPQGRVADVNFGGGAAVVIKKVHGAKNKKRLPRRAIEAFVASPGIGNRSC